jgi:hypothetical protein
VQRILLPIITKQARCELRCSERVSSSFSTCDTRLIAPFTNPVRSPQLLKRRKFIYIIKIIWFFFYYRRPTYIWQHRALVAFLFRLNLLWCSIPVNLVWLFEIWTRVLLALMIKAYLRSYVNVLFIWPGRVWRYQRDISESVNRWRTDNTLTKWKRTKGQKAIYKTLHRKQDRTTRTSLNNRDVNSGAPKGLAVPSPHVTPVLLLHLQTRWEVLNEEKTGGLLLTRKLLNQ